jgi:hypothetical protein
MQIIKGKERKEKFYFEEFDWYLPRKFKFVYIGPKYQALYMKAWIHNILLTATCVTQQYKTSYCCFAVTRMVQRKFHNLSYLCIAYFVGLCIEAVFHRRLGRWMNKEFERKWKNLQWQYCSWTLKLSLIPPCSFSVTMISWMSCVYSGCSHL